MSQIPCSSAIAPCRPTDNYQPSHSAQIHAPLHVENRENYSRDCGGDNRTQNSHKINHDETHNKSHDIDESCSKKQNQSHVVPSSRNAVIPKCLSDTLGESPPEYQDACPAERNKCCE